MRFSHFATPLQRNGDFLPMGGPFFQRGDVFMYVLLELISTSIDFRFIFQFVCVLVCASLLARLFMHPACTLQGLVFIVFCSAGSVHLCFDSVCLILLRCRCVFRFSRSCGEAGYSCHGVRGPAIHAAPCCCGWCGCRGCFDGFG